MDYEEYKRKALEPIVNYIESVMASYSKEELYARIKKALPEKESEDERIRKDIIDLIEFALKDGSAVSPGSRTTKEEAIAYLEKQKEQKPALRLVGDGLISDPNAHFELESEQQPAEWSEEDERMLQGLLVHLEGEEWVRNHGELENLHKWRDFLKSLRPQPHWKPSEEQMDHLAYAYTQLKLQKCYAPHVYESLGSLYDDLKKHFSL